MGPPFLTSYLMNAWKTFRRSVWFKRAIYLLVIVVVFVAGMRVSGPRYGYGVMESAIQDFAYSVTGSDRGGMKSVSYDEGYYEYEYEEALTAVPASAGEVYDLDTESRIIKTGSLTMDVKDTPETMGAINSIADAHGGFVQYSNTWLQSDETMAGSVTLRVAVEQFDAAMENLKALATVVSSESVSGEDVTAEYVDLQARLSNYEAEEAQYLEILESATTVEEMLMVSDYLASVRESIEVIQGQLKYYEDRTDYSTINIYVYEEASIVAPTRDWQPLVEIKKAFNKLVVIAQGSVNFVIWAVVLGVPAVIVVGVVRRVWRLFRRKK